MANLLWNESAPSDTDNAGQGDDEIRSLKTSIRNGMAQEHLWPSATGPGFGIHLLGSARAYFDVQSNVSSSGTEGRLMVTSDSSRLFHVGSAGTLFLGGNTTLSAGSQPSLGQRFFWAVEFGTGTTGGDASVIVSFPNSGFSAVPFVMANNTNAGSAILKRAQVGISSKGVSSFVATTFLTSGASAPSDAFDWVAIGQRSF